MANRSQVYSRETYKTSFTIFRSADHRSGIIVDGASGDLTPEAIYKTVNSTRTFVWEALGFLDVLDMDQQTLKAEVAALRQQVGDLKQELSATRTDFAAVQQTLMTISNFLGVVIPDWISREEVENGDDMGIVRPSAVSLGLTVNYIIDQMRPGFSHEQVVAIEPPAGSLVARGSTVNVTINLEG